MKIKILLVDDHQEPLESLALKIPAEIEGAHILTAGNCDIAYYHLQNNPDIQLLITDLTIQNASRFKIKQGSDLLKRLKEDNRIIPTIIYTDHHDLDTIFPVIDNFKPLGFVLKNTTSHEDLFLTIKKALRGERHYVQYINTELMKRIKFEFKLDEVNRLIIDYLPNIESADDWKNTSVGLSSKAIKARLEKMYINFNVENDKQLLLKLLRLGLIK